VKIIDVSLSSPKHQTLFDSRISGSVNLVFCEIIMSLTLAGVLEYAIPTFRRLMLQDCKFKSSLREIVTPFLKNKTKQNMIASDSVCMIHFYSFGL
jgi:hypothetical protein